MRVYRLYCALERVVDADIINNIDMSRIVSFFKKFFTSGENPAEVPHPVEKYNFPSTMEEFGYRFNDYGELRHISTGEPFNFYERQNDHNYNQQRYDALGELVTEYVYDIMEKELKLERVYIPEDARKEDPQSFIFMSPGALTNSDKLMLLIHGAGVVRAGQWTRKLIINENLEKGSQIPYIRRAFEKGFEVIVFNTNLNQVTINGKLEDVKDNQTPEDHGIYIWRHFVQKAAARNIAIVAHSYGGIVTFTLAKQFLEDFKERVFSIVFTDSVHAFKRSEWPADVKQLIKERAVNFAASYVPINVLLNTADSEDCCSVSAGTEEHERTSYTSIDMAFKYIQENYDSWTRDKTMATHNFLPLPEDLSPFQPSNRWNKVEAAEAVKPDEEEREEKKEPKEDVTNNQSDLTMDDNNQTEKSETQAQGVQNQIEESNREAELEIKKGIVVALEEVGIVETNKSKVTGEADSLEMESNRDEVKMEAAEYDALETKRDDAVETKRDEIEGMKGNDILVTETGKDNSVETETKMADIMDTDQAKIETEIPGYTSEEGERDKSVETDKGKGNYGLSSDEGLKQSEPESPGLESANDKSVETDKGRSGDKLFSDEGLKKSEPESPGLESANAMVPEMQASIDLEEKTPSGIKSEL
ncbi:uncharacterized protein LOC112553723 isoform X3 [Pomacea canaliculata]|uniref:uncharacterized protein LOC112553723 isoform X3 n=1 Tax=Pomacea canaliculata TaxID=400727 RepID=UPI000D73B223|nr:uncharacterized protein LOC112553723 isoform X3 [Pomacea canaliculata]